MVARRYWAVAQFRNAGDGSYSGITRLQLRTAPGGPDITQQYAFFRALNSNSPGWGGYTIRERIQAAQLSTADQCFVRLEAASNAGLTITSCYIQTKGTGGFDFSGTPIQVMFGGSPGVALSAGQSVVSDEIALVLTGSDDVVISIYTATTSAYRQSSSSTGTSISYKSGDDAATVIASGYTGSSAPNFVGAIQRTANAPVASVVGSVQSGSPAGFLDTDDNTQVQLTGTNGGLEYRVDLGEGNEAEVVEIAITPNKDGVTRTPAFFEVRSSDDAWDTHAVEWIGYNVSWTLATPETFTKPSPAPHRYWAMRALSTEAGVTLGCREAEFRTAIGGSDTTAGKTAFAMSTFDGSTVPGNAFDDNLATQYSGSSAAPGSEFLAIDYGSGNTETVLEIKWTARLAATFSNHLQSPAVGQMISSPDGRSFVYRWGFSAAPWTSGSEQVFSATPETPAVRRRLLISN